MNKKGTRRWWVLGTISFAILAITLDVTVLSLALPTLADQLKASESQLQWFVSAYTLALVAGMLPSGLIGDKYGRKKLLLISLLVFAAGSFACAYAPNASIFMIARVVLGLAGAAIIVVALSMLTVLFDADERPRAIGIWSAANFIGMPLGPILGGWLLSHAWWGWIFLMNVPVALLAFIAILILVPESHAPESPCVDFLGLILSSAGLVGLMYSVIEAGRNGWGYIETLLPLVIGLLLLVIFVFWEKWVAQRPKLQPLVDLTLFRSRAFTWGMILTGLGVLGLFGAMFTLPQYFQAIMNVDPQGSGIRLLPLIAGLVAGAAPSDRVAARIGTKLTVAIGFTVVVFASLVGSTMTVTSGDWFTAAWSFGIGLGGGMAFATTASAALVGLPEERSGVASALLQAFVKLGPAFGSSVLGSILNATYQNKVDVKGLPIVVATVVKSSVFAGLAVAQKMGLSQLVTSVKDAFVSGVDASLVVTAGMTAVCIILAVVFLPRSAKVKQSSATMDK